MGLISRLRRLTVSRIEAFLSNAEDPELIFPQLVREMEDQVRAATEAEAKAMAAVKAARRELDEIQLKLDTMTSGAELAMAKGDEDTAREAVASQIALESEVERKQEAIARADTALEDARSARKQIQSQLVELRDKKDELLSRARVAKNQKKIEQTVNGQVNSSESILDAVARLETSVEETEAEVEVRREMGRGGTAPSLEKRLKDLETRADVDDRLAALKKKVGNTPAEA